MKELENTQDAFTPKTAAKIVGVDAELLKIWSNEFSILTERTEGGHRRYSKENIEELQAIKERLHEQNWSYDQIRAWRNGELEVFVAKEQTSELEKKMDKLLDQMEMQQKHTERQEQFNQALAMKLTEAMNQIGRLQIENESLKTLISDRDQVLIQSLKETLKQRQAEHQKEQERKSEEKPKKRFGLLNFFRS